MVVARFEALHEAELTAAYLRSCEIPARVDENLVAAMNPLWGLALGGSRVFVPASFGEEARRALEELNSERGTGAIEIPEPAAGDAESKPSEAEPEPSHPGTGGRRRRRAAPPRSRQGQLEDAAARRALALGIVGLMLCPGVLNAVALILAWRIPPDRVSRFGRRYRTLAIWFNVAIFLALALAVALGPYMRASSAPDTPSPTPLPTVRPLIGY
ncbi:MAG: hypothetical protein JW751_30965 [Polyangiaceae bacterium]|nr:hypothetical protein [Polyangiaceae bacterium]